MERYLTTTEVARLLGAKWHTAKKWIRQGKLPARKILGRWRVKESDVLRLIESAPTNGAVEENQPECV